MKYLPLILVLPLLTVGCTETASPISEHPTQLQAASSAVQDYTSQGIRVAHPDGDFLRRSTEEERVARGEAVLDLVRGMQMVTATERDWRVAHRRLAALIEQPSALPRSMAEQWVAGYVLQNYLLPAPSQEKQPLIAHHARVLVQHRNPEGNLIADALEAAGPALPAAERRALAAQAAVVAREVAQKDAQCGEGCGPALIERKLRELGAAGATSDPATQAIRAISRLDQIARG